MVKKRSIRAGETSFWMDCGYSPLRAIVTASSSTSDAKTCSFTLRYRDRLEEEHGDRVGFLARAASGVPDADRLVRRLPAYQLGNDLLRQDREHLFVAVKSGDVDQHGFG